MPQFVHVFGRIRVYALARLRWREIDARLDPSGQAAMLAAANRREYAFCRDSSVFVFALVRFRVI